MFTCEEHKGCVLVYIGRECPWCKQERVAEHEKEGLIKELDTAKEEIENLRDDIKGLHQ